VRCKANSHAPSIVPRVAHLLLARQHAQLLRRQLRALAPSAALGALTAGGARGWLTARGRRHLSVMWEGETKDGTGSVLGSTHDAVCRARAGTHHHVDGAQQRGAERRVIGDAHLSAMAHAGVWRRFQGIRTLRRRK
jgi:hypothetical protein